MLWLIINGAKPYDGRYEFDLTDAEFTTREWGWIKKLSGYLPLTIQDGFEGGDPELFAAFAIVALYRAGKVDKAQVQDVYDRLADTPFGTTIRLEDDTEAEADEADAGPPASSSNGSSSSSGTGSSESSASSDATPSAAGTDGSATSELPPARLVT